MLELGGHIKLNGFHNVDPPSMIVIKKIVGNYVKRFQEEAPSFQELLLDLADPSKENIRIYAQLTGAKTCEAEVSDVNLFFAIDKVLFQIMNEVKKER